MAKTEYDAELIFSVEKLQELQFELQQVNEDKIEKVWKIEQVYNEKRRAVYDRRKEILKAIPGFWMEAFLKHPVLGDLFSESDLKILRNLESLDVEEFKDGFSISFVFKPNMYFEDTKLTKSFKILEDGTTEISATAIKWKGGRGALNGDIQKKKGKKRPRSKDSFFSWFSEKQQKTIDYVVTDEVAVMILKELWPDPLRYISDEVDEEDSDAVDGDGWQ